MENIEDIIYSILAYIIVEKPDTSLIKNKSN